jgi:transcription elongation factor S-II|tara:strand:- start:10 stop:537 length:528 start_codon:yes stop_codon:yes gene_type:complete
MDNTSYKVNIRNQSYGLLNKILENEKSSRQIEQSIYNETIRFSSENNIKRLWDNKIFKSLYLSRIRSIYTNLKGDSYLQNKNLKNKILEKKIDPRNISSLSRYDIFPEIWGELLKKLAEKDKLKYELKPEAMTDMFKCRKCGSRSCAYYEFQTRSADEPMTQFITCLDCNNNWKQ